MRDVAGLLVTSQERTPRTLLVFKRGCWFFPGGKRERGEYLMDTVRREVMEELSLRIAGSVQHIHEGVFPAIGGTHYRFHTFVCSADQLVGVPALDPDDSVRDFAWVDKPWELNLTTHARFVIGQFGVGVLGGV